MRINKMITQDKIYYEIISLNQFFKEMYGDQFGEFVCGYWLWRILTLKINQGTKFGTLKKPMFSYINLM